MKFFLENEEKNSSLRVHEWLAIAIVIGVIGGLACLTSMNKKNVITAIESKNSIQDNTGFDVIIKGAVDNPGIYRIHSEMKMKDLLAIAGVNSKADLRRFSLEAIVKKGRVINVPLRSMITIQLKGAVKVEGIISLPKGSKVEDLIGLVEFSENAELKSLKKKRRLKQAETIYVPFK